jgi:hypothetical protein
MSGSRPEARKEDALNPKRSERTGLSGLRFVVATARNAMSSITLHSVSKLRLPLSIREYSGHYTGVYTWK